MSLTFPDPGQGGQALDQLLPLVYEELLAIARRRLRRELPGNTLDTASLVHEAYLRFAKQPDFKFRNRQHFLALASMVMRRVLVDHARRVGAEKRGSNAVAVDWSEVPEVQAESPFLDGGTAAMLLRLDEALNRLAEFNPRGAKVVEQRFFAGLSEAEIGDAIGVSERTVRRIWTVARGWLRRELDDKGSETILLFEAPRP